MYHCGDSMSTGQCWFWIYSDLLPPSLWQTVNGTNLCCGSLQLLQGPLASLINELLAQSVMGIELYFTRAGVLLLLNVSLLQHSYRSDEWLIIRKQLTPPEC